MARSSFTGSPYSNNARLFSGILVCAIHLAFLPLMFFDAKDELPSEDPVYISLARAKSAIAPPTLRQPLKRQTERKARHNARQNRRIPRVSIPDQAVVQDLDTTVAGLSEPPSPALEELALRARQLAGAVDRELRHGVAAPAEVDSPVSRMRRGLESAYAGGAMGATADIYVSPDGVSITRWTRNSGARCYVRAAVNASPSAVLGAGGAREVNCPPANAGWQRQL